MLRQIALIEKSQAGCSCQNCLLDGENVEVFVSMARLTALQQTILRAKSSVSVIVLWCLSLLSLLLDLSLSECVIQLVCLMSLWEREH